MPRQKKNQLQRSKCLRCKRMPVFSLQRIDFLFGTSSDRTLCIDLKEQELEPYVSCKSPRNNIYQAESHSKSKRNYNRKMGEQFMDV